MAKQQPRPYKAIALLSEPNARLVGVGSESFIIAGRKHTHINQPTCEMLLEKGWITEPVQDASGICAAVLTDTGRAVAKRIAAAAGKYRQIYAPWAEENATGGIAEEELAALAGDGKGEDEPPSPQNHPAAAPPREESARPSAHSELTERQQWVNWTAEPRRDGIAKPPYQPGSNSKARTDDPVSWGTHRNALKAVESGQHTGIGYVFSEDDPYTGIDLDKCRNPETGLIKPWALRIIDRFNSYTEISPSGTGVHIYVKGTLSGAARRRNQVEAYGSGQYFTWTGEHLPGTPMTIEPRQEQLDELSRWLNPATTTARRDPPHRPAAENTKESTVGGYGARARYGRQVSNDEVLANARNAKNGAYFCQLYDHGKIGKDQTHSEADFVLCLLLDYWTNGDAGQIGVVSRNPRNF